MKYKKSQISKIPSKVLDLFTVIPLHSFALGSIQLGFQHISLPCHHLEAALFIPFQWASKHWEHVMRMSKLLTLWNVILRCCAGPGTERQSHEKGLGDVDEGANKFIPPSNLLASLVAQRVCIDGHYHPLSVITIHYIACKMPACTGTKLNKAYAFHIS